jgi:hypothetical protein
MPITVAAVVTAPAGTARSSPNAARIKYSGSLGSA